MGDYCSTHFFIRPSNYSVFMLCTDKSERNIDGVSLIIRGLSSILELYAHGTGTRYYVQLLLGLGSGAAGQ